MKKRDKIIFGISLICMVLVVLVGLTYAYWLSIKKQTSRNLIATSCLDLTMADESVEIKRENSYPMSDEKGLSTTPYTFKLINNCNIKTKVSFVLDIDKTEDFSLDMFKAAMNNHEIEWEPEKLSKLDTELNPDTIQYHKIVVTDTIEAQETKEYELRLWIDKDVTINDVVARFTSKLRITMEPYRQCGMTITDPNPGEFRGTGTEDDPYLIESIEDLVALSLNTKAGILEPYKYYKLTTDLDFECESSYADWQSTNYGDINGNEVAQDLKSELTTGNGFYPIGIYSKDKEFRSNFNGGYHTINNLYSKNSNTGLFGYVKTEDTVITIKNVDIGIKDLQGTYIGGVVAEGHSNIKSGIVIKNIRADGELNPKGYVSKVAGVCGYGYSVKIENCINKVSIKTDNYSYAGGIAGELYGSFELNNLTNYGSIEAKNGSNTGGIIGDAIGAEANNLTNYADLQATSSGGSGGIAGRFSDVNSSNLTNYGNLTFSGSGRGYGGIVGDHDDSSAHDCYNYGNVEFTSTGSYGSVGGIMGYQDGQNYLYNIGNASSFIKVNRFSTGSLYGSNMRIGGVIGGIDYGNSVNNVYNYADIIYNSEGDGDTSNVSINIGGLFGHKNTSYDTNINGYNTGNITVISNNPKEKILVSGIEADGTGYNMSKTYFIGDISVTSINSESEVCGFSNQMYLGNNNYSTFYYKGSILSNTNTYGFSKKFESNVDNVYLDLITNEQTPFLYNIFDVSSSRSGKGFTNAYYRIVGNSNYTKNEGSVEYNFDNVDGLWFRDTLNLGDSWKYEEGYYPLMYKSDINKNPTTELLDGQIKKAIE